MVIQNETVYTLDIPNCIILWIILVKTQNANITYCNLIAMRASLLFFFSGCSPYFILHTEPTGDGTIQYIISPVFFHPRVVFIIIIIIVPRVQLCCQSIPNSAACNPPGCLRNCTNPIARGMTSFRPFSFERPKRGQSGSFVLSF